jgi:hypothetical protein
MPDIHQMLCQSPIRHFCCVLLFVLLAGAPELASCLHKQQLSAEDVFKKVSPSIFSIEIYEGGEVKVRASAVAAMSFLSSDDQALTFSAFDKIAARSNEKAHGSQWPLLEQAGSPSEDREGLPTDIVVTNCHVLDGAARDGRHETLYFRPKRDEADFCSNCGARRKA